MTISLQNLINEDKIVETIKNRSNAVKLTLLVMRVLFFSTNIALLASSWYAIFLVNVYQNTITEYMAAKFSWLSYVAAFVPAICLTLLNTLVPMITNLIIYLERWDYQSTITNNQIWRNFVLKELNIIIFFFLNVNMLIPMSALSSAD